MRVRLESIGCRLNTGEMEGLARELAARGHRVVAAGEPADLLLLNTCAVTAVASRKSRQLVRRAAAAHPGAAVAVTGCYAEIDPTAALSLGVDLVVGNREKDRIADLLEDAGLLAGAAPPDDASASPFPPGDGRTRAFVKVQDGCDNRCAFCVVTIARGPGRSRDGDEVVAEISGLAAAGFREVVLTGVHLGSYGHDLGQPRGLERLVRRVLAETSLERLRLSSLEPWDLDRELLLLLREPRLLPHLHLPLQSGCDATLRRMARRTTTTGFAALVAAARDLVPDLAVSTDVMVGFPGESEAEFEQSLAFVEAMAFSRLHVFRYSPRPGTAAAAMKRQVPGPVAGRRSRRMHELAARLESAFHRSLLGRRVEVLWEDGEPRGHLCRWSGLTGSYARVVAETGSGTDLANTVTEVDLVGAVPGALVGRLVA